VAFALVEAENNESWSWFMAHLRVHVLGASRTICLISDRHAGILNAAVEPIDGCPPLVHRWCMRHFAANFWWRQRKKEVSDMLKKLCQTFTQHAFQETYRELEKLMNQASKAWLQRQMENKAKWALAYDEGGYRYGIMCTNASESFNKVFKGVRSLPVLGIVEYSFTKCNAYFIKRWGEAHRDVQEKGPYGGAVAEFLKHEEELVPHQIAEPYGPERLIYTVRGAGGTGLGGERYGGRTYRLDLQRVECTCNVPQIMHAPCSHMMTACRHRGYNYLVPPYMSPLYLRSNMFRIWEKSFEPYLDPAEWPPYHGLDYIPHWDLKKVGKGRRKKKRLRGDMDAMQAHGQDMYGGGDFDETRGRNLCSICKQPGHKASWHRRQSQQDGSSAGPSPAAPAAPPP